MNKEIIVIIGGPGTGKSTIIDGLIDKGFCCYPEISRQVTLEAKKQGIEQLFLENPLLFSELLLEGRTHFMKYTQLNVDKLEDILGESAYVVRYERGTFQSGWCLLEARKVVVLNKFLNTEGRINTLIDLIPQLNISYDKLTLESQKLYDSLLKNAALALAVEPVNLI